MSGRSGRWWLVVVILPGVVMIAAVLPLIAFRDRYPDPLAVHWSLGGAPNGSMPIAIYSAAMIGGLAAAFVALIAGSFRSLPSAPLTSLVAFIMGLLAAINAQIVVFNLDAASWEDAAPMTPVWLIGVVAAGLVSAWIGWLLAGGTEGIPRDVPIEAVTVSRDTWSGRASNIGLLVVAVLPVLLIVTVSPIVAPLLVCISVAVVVFSSVTVDVDSDGVTISLGPFAWPARHVAHRDITGAAAFEIQPMAYGGWGYRLSSGARAYVIRRGEAIRIGIAAGPDVLVTVDGAAEGAAVIDSLADGRSGGEYPDR